MVRFFIFAILLSASPSWAERSVQIGATLESFDYQEDMPAGLRSREAGWIPFFDFALRSPLAENISMRAELQSTFSARTLYEGTNLATGEDITATDAHTMHRLEGVLTYRLGAFDLYGGVSYNHWDRFLAYGSQYREIYRWWTVPLGAVISVPAGAGSFEMEGALLWMVKGDLAVIFSETITDGDDTVLTLGNRVGFRLRAPYRFSWRDLHWAAGPSIQWTAFGASETETNSTPGLGGSVREPASQTLRWGFSLSLIRTF